MTAPAAPCDLDDAVAPATSRSEAERARLAARVGAGLVWLGLYGMYVRLWVQPQDARGNLERWARPVAEGTAAAPFQYRFAVPGAMTWAADHLAWPFGFTLQLVDAVALIVGAVAFDRLLQRLELGMWALPAALYGGFLGLGVVWWGKFETMAAFAAMTVATAALLGLVRHRSLVLAGCALVLIGTRTDLLFALAVAEAARWWWIDRRPGALRTALALGATAAIATVGLSLAYPDAAYDEATGVVQVWHNLQPTNLAIAAAFLLPALLPHLLRWRGPQLQARLEADRATWLPLLALVGAQVASVALIGRADEVRLFFPLVAALSILGIVGWRAVVGLVAAETTSEPAPRLG
jgi:hypothetical protein